MIENSCSALVFNLNTGRVVTWKLKTADNFWKRFLGLLPYRNLPDGAGLLLTQCSSVHTFFMRFDIDVLYLDREMRVVAAFSNVKPWRLLPIIRGVRQVLEISSGVLSTTGTITGHQLHFLK